MSSSRFTLVCPQCRAELNEIDETQLRCPVDELIYARRGQVWQMLPPEQAGSLSQFIREYETIRLAEGRESREAEYYRQLPFQDVSGRRSGEWAIRAQSFQTMLDRVIKPMEGHGPLRILDLGAGNGWLSNQLAGRGHHLAAVDLTVNDYDGLGAAAYYERPFLALQATFDRLPVADGQADLAIFNASLHYSTDYEATLKAILPILREMGKFVVVDTPIYQDGQSGASMVRERQLAFQQEFGFASDALDSENYLTYERLRGIGDRLGFWQQLHWPVPGWRRQVRRWRARWRGQREPAQFPVIVWGRRAANDGDRLSPGGR